MHRKVKSLWIRRLTVLTLQGLAKIHVGVLPWKKVTASCRAVDRRDCIWRRKPANYAQPFRQGSRRAQAGTSEGIMIGALIFDLYGSWRASSEFCKRCRLTVHGSIERRKCSKRTAICELDILILHTHTARLRGQPRVQGCTRLLIWMRGAKCPLWRPSVFCQTPRPRSSLGTPHWESVCPGTCIMVPDRVNSSVIEF